MKTRQLTVKEELFNSISHGIGVILAILGLIVLLILSKKNGSILQSVCFSIFCISMILLYMSSTIYHSIKDKIRKERFNKVDHSMIYVLIAGTYTPVTLTILRGVVGWVMFGIIWALAIFGIVYKVFFYKGKKKERTISAVLYLLMGWIIIFAIVPLVKTALPVTLWFLSAGCLSYSLSIIFYLNSKFLYSHGIFHVFILVGSICHYFSFLVTVI